MCRFCAPILWAHHVTDDLEIQSNRIRMNFNVPENLFVNGFPYKIGFLAKEITLLTACKDLQNIRSVEVV